MLMGWLCACLAHAAPTHAGGASVSKDFSIAFYYAPDVPWEALGAFDVAVVDPGNVGEALWHHRLNPATQVAAYVSLGEVQPSRPYFSDTDPSWRLGTNSDWGSVVMDQTQPRWREFFVQRVITPLWKQGYTAFFLDTMDSFHLVASTTQAKARQADGLAQLVRDIKTAHPQAKLIFNRGFEVLPLVHTLAHAVAAESLFQGYDTVKKAYRDVPASDREWLWGQLKRCKEQYGLPVIAIDYLPAEQRHLAVTTASKIRALGAIAWVATPELNHLGVGNVDLISRQVLAIHDEPGDMAQVATHEMHRLGEMPLNALGLDARLVAAGSSELGGHAQRPLVGRFAGVIMWFNRGRFPTDPNVLKVFNRARSERVPVVIVGELPDDGAFEPFDIDIGDAQKLTGPLQVEKLSPHVGFEVLPSPTQRELFPTILRNPNAPGTEVWLRVKTPSQVYSDAIAITPWGGYAAERFWKLDLPQGKGERWAVDPIEFFKRALRVDGRTPMPDVTSDNGRRFLMVHIDGDGFASRAEIPGTPLASEVMLKEFLERYTVPTTVSIIQAEVGGTGLYQALSPKLESIAKRMFALPHVELATHSFSHPFFWAEAEQGKSRGTRAVGLTLPDYRFNLAAEIAGSADYINRRLAPRGKRTRMMLWTGDTQPLEAPVREAYRAGLLNMNGGYTVITRSDQSLTLVGPLGIMKGDYFQVYAPNQNENVYTNNWTGPFYGFERVIETFELTESPRRLKPVNIYYHTYIASKPASIASLHKVYAWAQSQALHPIAASAYAQRVLDWRRASVARVVSGDGAPSVLELRAGGTWLKQWRQDWVAASDTLGPLGAQHGWAGQKQMGQQRLLHAIKNIATYPLNTLANLENDAKNTPPITLSSANASLTQWTPQGSNLRLGFDAAVALSVELETDCSLDQLASSPGLGARRTGRFLTIEGANRGPQELLLRCAR